MKTKALKILFGLFLISLPLHAVEINLVKVESAEGQNLSRVFSQGYGYPVQQVSPLFGAPVEEIPTLLRIAQVAKVSPNDVWTLRRSGMGYDKILTNYRMTPTVFGSNSSFTSLTDDIVLNLGRTYLYQNILGINPDFFPYLPSRGLPFAQSILYPYHPSYGYFMPPGIAKKYGLWVPPGQRKKVAWGNLPNNGKFYGYETVRIQSNSNSKHSNHHSSPNSSKKSHGSHGHENSKHENHGNGHGNGNGKGHGKH